MKSTIAKIYERLILSHPMVTLFLTLVFVLAFAWQIPKFQLDASGDSLVLENDADLYYARNIAERYSTSDILVLTYTPHGDLFAPETLADLKAMRDELRSMEGIQSVTTMLDVPLLLSTDISLSDLEDVDKVKTLEKFDVARETVLAELEENPFYKGRMLSPDRKTTSVLIALPVDKTYRALLKRRYELREKEYNNSLTPQQAGELDEVSREYRRYLTLLTQRESRVVEAVRVIADRHRGAADIYLGGVPMIVADMIAFIRNDLVVFGIGVGIFLIVTLTIIFRKLRWVFLPMLCCAMAVVTMMGCLGMVDWRVTVISSNFISLMIILTMSLTIHLIQRYLEVQAASPEADQRTLVLETVRTIVLPCFYTTLTTMVAFTSLLVSEIRPVMDFGMMMTIGLIVSFVLAFILFPATVVLLKKGKPEPVEDRSNPFTMHFARFTEAHGRKILVGTLLIILISVAGISRLKVENKFIDYFRKSTEIYQGLSLIDTKLGGTTPLDLIIDFDKKAEVTGEVGDDELFDDPFAEEAAGDGVSYWFADAYTMEQIERVHDYLLDLPEVGEVVSLATAGKIATRLNDNIPLDNYELTLLQKHCPSDIKELLVAPYVSEDITQARLTMRIVESNEHLERTALLGKIKDFLVGEMKFEKEQIHFTNMYVLYNNMLQSLFRSQILTIGVVFLGILVMFTILFRSFYLALIAVVPNVLPVVVVLGVLGWLGIPLDLMTITIASISIGIAVDDTIHYVHRFQREFPKDRNYLAAVKRCHCSIGRAMYYTSITITIGFSILVLSNFLPTIYFGLFTGFAMVVALLADLTLLPQLLIVLKPLGPEEG
ncbi:MAG: MMPL family transporter [Desulfobulbaceae bacterium]|nr:MMPL family transporter [Desulfobulbaceae bacterium]HIJ78427.1 MMPL family transporter [Deltaproteobacteria bacterium]